MQNNKIFFGYTRISDDKYDKSLSSQKAIIIESAKRIGIAERDIEWIEERQSGSKKANRKKFTDMLSRLIEDNRISAGAPSKRKYGGILCFKIDRLARNDKDFALLFELLEAGYKFVSATETIENTPTGRLLFRMLCSFAVFESEKLSNRISLTQIYFLLQKKFVNLGGKSIIFGYRGNDILIDGKKKKEAILRHNVTKKIVYKIYAIFETLLEEHPKKKPPTNRQVYDCLNEDEQKELINHLKKGGAGASSTDDLIGKIVNNNNMLGYDGIVRRRIGVKDELVEKYIKIVREGENEFYKVEGDGEIGGTVMFSFFIPQLQIVDTELYHKVKSQTKYYKSKGNRKHHSLRGVFHDILHIEVFGNVLHLADSYQKKEKNRYYRPKAKYTTKAVSIPEKKLMLGIKNTGILTMIKAIFHQKEFLQQTQNAIVGIAEQHIAKEKKSLLGEIKFITHLRDQANFHIQYPDINEKTNRPRLYASYIERLTRLQEQLAELETTKINSINRFMELGKQLNANQRNMYQRHKFFSIYFEQILVTVDARGVKWLHIKPISTLLKHLPIGTKPTQLPT